MYKNGSNEIVCPFCGNYGLIEIFESKMTKDQIYRCDECLGIYESLCDLEYNLQTQVGSGYAEMIHIDLKQFETETNKLGRLTISN